jgi:hypothetical protein
MGRPLLSVLSADVIRSTRGIVMGYSQGLPWDS